MDRIIFVLLFFGVWGFVHPLFEQKQKHGVPLTALDTQVVAFSSLWGPRVGLTAFVTALVLWLRLPVQSMALLTGVVTIFAGIYWLSISMMTTDRAEHHRRFIRLGFAGTLLWLSFLTTMLLLGVAFLSPEIKP